MSRLYTVMAGATEIAAHFDAEILSPVAVLGETIEGNPGLVALESNSRRVLKSMSWRFPRLTREMRLRGDPPGRIGLVADLTNPMWEQIVVDPRYRCLIPISHFANPNGDPGEKTRSWFSVNGEPLVAWAGFCRNTPEFGPVYAGMTMTANAAVEPYNDRMPALLIADEYERWLHGSIQDVIDFQFRPPIAAVRIIPTIAGKVASCLPAFGLSSRCYESVRPQISEKPPPCAISTLSVRAQPKSPRTLAYLRRSSSLTRPKRATLVRRGSSCAKKLARACCSR